MSLEKKRFFDKRMTFLVSVQILTFLTLFFLIFYNQLANKKDEKKEDLNYLRQLGNKLQAVGVLSESLKHYQKYFFSSQIDSEKRAKLAFTLGELSEKEGFYEQALSWFYLVEIFDASRQYQNDASKRIVSILERLKKFGAVKYTLQESTKLGKGQNTKKGGAIVAKVAGKNIYLHEVNESLDDLPPMIRKNMETKEGKINWTKKYIADMLLFQKATRLRLHQDPDLRKKMDRLEKQLMVNKILNDEIHKNISTNKSDIKNYFEANKDKYAEKEKVSFEFIKIKSKKMAYEIFNKLKKKKSDLKKLALEYSLKESTNHLEKGRPFLGESMEISKKIFKLPLDQASRPFLLKGHYYIVKILEKSNAKQYTYNDIQEQVEQDYRLSKEKELYQKLIDETLKTEKIELFLDQVK